MRRAVLLIIILTALGVGCGLWADISQRDTAREYLGGLEAVRQAVLTDDMQAAAREQAYWHALWQRDETRLNFLLTHEHTRSVSAAMMRLATALEQGWREEALKSLDDVTEAFRHIETGDFPAAENIF